MQSDDTLTGARLVEAGSLVTDCDCIATTGALCRDNCPCKRHARAALRAEVAAAVEAAETLMRARHVYERRESEMCKAAESDDWNKERAATAAFNLATEEVAKAEDAWAAIRARTGTDALAEVRKQARREGIEAAAAYMDTVARQSPRWGSPEEHAAAIRALLEDPSHG